MLSAQAPPPKSPPLHIAFYCSLMAWPKPSSGGVRPWTLRLVNELIEQGHHVDVLSEAPFKRFRDEPSLSPKAGRVILGTGIAAKFRLGLYLLRNPGVRLVTALNRYNNWGALLKLLLGSRFELTITQHEHLSADAQWKTARQFWINTRSVRLLWKHADSVVAVSRGVADDLVQHWGVPQERLHVIHNPAYTAAHGLALARNVDRTPPHPWFRDERVPVIVSAGRLHPVKGFDDLLKAFAILRRELPSRLIILGAGPEERALHALVGELGLSGSVALPGRVNDIAPWLAHANAFVLSSRREGFGNVLVEALAVGAPIVSTRCPSGPDEILGDGRWGTLVEVGDVQAMADAIRQTLQAPPVDREALVLRAQHFSVDRAVGQYLALWRPNPLGAPAPLSA